MLDVVWNGWIAGCEDNDHPIPGQGMWSRSVQKELKGLLLLHMSDSNVAKWIRTLYGATHHPRENSEDFLIVHKFIFQA